MRMKRGFGSVFAIVCGGVVLLQVASAQR
eukprot:COSAG02_NODE_33603_length_497_cov_1.806533_1_plen_28_part_10